MKISVDQISIRIQNNAFDPEAEQRQLRTGWRDMGALVAFVGLMRDFHDGEIIEKMYLEHYPGMTEQSLQRLATDAWAQWPLHTIRIVHRVGLLQPQEPIVLVAVGSRHRREAFAACMYLIDKLKEQVPLWKKQQTAQSSHWVSPAAGYGG